MEAYVASMSWLFYTVHQRTLWCMYPFRSCFSLYMPRSGTAESYGSSLCWEDPLEEGTAIHSSTLAWRESHGEKSLEGCSLESHRVRHNWNNLACTHIHGSSNFRFLRTFHAVLHSVLTSLHIHLQCRRFSFSPLPLQHLLCEFFDASHSGWCEVLSHCSLDLHFYNN